MAELNSKQRRFVEEFLVDLNATQAAIRCGYSERTAAQQASRLLSDVKIQAAIQEGQAARSQRTEITADLVVQELARMALFDPADLVRRPITKPEDIATLPEHVRRVIAGWSWDKQGNFVLKLAPKTPNLELLGRHLGMFTDKVQHSADDALREMMGLIDATGRPRPGGVG